MATITKKYICRHCGTPFTPKANESFCCHGCQYVAQLLRENGLTRFYELKGDSSLPPIGSRAFREADTKPLQDEVDKAEVLADKRPVAMARFSVEGISCIGCVWLIEAIFNRLSGSARARIDPRTHSVELAWQKGHFDMAAFSNELQKVGYRLTPFSEDPQGDSSTRQITQRLGLCGFFLLNTMLFTLPGYLGMTPDFFLAPIFKMLAGLFATLSFLVGGGYFISRAWHSLRSHVLHIDFPIALGLIAAYLGSLVGVVSGYATLVYFDFVATFVLLMLAGRWLQEYALERNRAHLQRQKVGPRDVTIVGGARDGERVSVKAIEKNWQYSVGPGVINPVAADLISEEATLSLEWINGEPEPVVWQAPKVVPAGAINVGLTNRTFRAREAWSESLLAQLLERPADSFRDERLQGVLKYYIMVVLAIATLGGLGWAFLSGDLLRAVQVFISILIVSCPCATGVALPMCNEFATSRLRRAGLFIKSGQIWERLRQVNTVVFDKTGTLTMDIPWLIHPERVRQLDSLSAYALFKLVENNLHPIARSLREVLLAEHPQVNQSGGKDSETEQESEVKESVGKGVSWSDSAGNQWTLGKAEWRAHPESSRIEGRSVLRENGYFVAAFDFEEDVRDDAREAVEDLKRWSLNIAILSGDASARVQAIAAKLELDPGLVEAECKAHEKAEWIRNNAPGSALMIGDGANDSLAFDQAVCRGTPVVDRSILEASADFFFFGRSLRCLPELFATAAARRRTVYTIFIVAILYNLGAIGFCLAGMMHPLLAAIIMPLSSIATLVIAWLGLGKTAQRSTRVPG